MKRGCRPVRPWRDPATRHEIVRAGRRFRDGTGASLPIFSWRDGAATNDLAANNPGVGGNILATHAGTYRVVVRNQTGATCPEFRLSMAKSNITTEALPAW